MLADGFRRRDDDALMAWQPKVSGGCTPRFLACSGLKKN